MHRFFFSFEILRNNRPGAALLLVVAIYVGLFLALIIATLSFPERATEWAVVLLSAFTFWLVRTGIHLVRHLHKRFQGPKR